MEAATFEGGNRKYVSSLEDVQKPGFFHEAVILDGWIFDVRRVTWATKNSELVDFWAK